MRYLTPLQKTMIGHGLINFNNFFLKSLRLAALRRLGANLLRPITVDGKNFFDKVYEME